MKLIKHARMTCQAICYYTFTALCRKDEKLWMFGAWKGQSYNDNSKYLFEYVLAHDKSIRAYWITKSQSVYDKLQREGKPVLLWPTKEAKSMVRHAKFVFQTEGNRDIGQFRPGNCNVIQLWHGIAAKKLNWYKNYSKIKRAIIEIEADNHRRSLWFATSQYYASFYSNCFGIDMKQFIITGYSRDDVLFRRNLSEAAAKIRRFSGTNKIIAYLPTHRNFGKDFNPAFVVNGLQSLDKKFAKLKLTLVYKPHQNEAYIVREYMNQSNLSFLNVFLASGDEFNDVYEYLTEFDCVISDYSSVVYDYLCLDRPIVFFNYDIESYEQNDAGLDRLYYDTPAGPFCKTWEELCDTIESEIIEDHWKVQRQKCRQVLNPYNDGYNSKRIYECLKKMLQKKDGSYAAR